MIALQDRGGNPTARDIEELGIPVVELGIERLRQRGAYREVAAAIRRSQPDLVHTQLEFSNVLGAAAASRAGLPVVSTLHTLEEPARWSRAWLRMRVMAWSLRRHADRVIAVSEHARQHHLRHLGLPADLVETIHNGIDTGRFVVPRADGERARAEMGIPPTAKLIITVAVLRPPKGIDVMLGALPDILRESPMPTTSSSATATPGPIWRQRRAASVSVIGSRLPDLVPMYLSCWRPPISSCCPASPRPFPP